jgi:hypothetical protein
MRWALAALLLSTTALADPSAALLPKEPPPAAVDLSGNGKWIVTGVVAGAAITAALTVLAIVVMSSLQVHTLPTGCTAERPCP